MTLKQDNNTVTLLSNPERAECSSCYERMTLLGPPQAFCMILLPTLGLKMLRGVTQ